MPLAQSYLGEMYYDGKGVAQNHVTAFRWYRRAADKGEVHAQFRLGWMYSRGEGTLENPKESLKWYKLAAEQGNAAAQNNIGVLCGLGGDKPANQQGAVNWFQKPAEKGDNRAQYNLAMRYKNGLGVKQDYAQALTVVKQSCRTRQCPRPIPVGRNVRQREWC